MMDEAFLRAHLSPEEYQRYIINPYSRNMKIKLGHLETLLPLEQEHATPKYFLSQTVGGCMANLYPPGSVLICEKLDENAEIESYKHYAFKWKHHSLHKMLIDIGEGCFQGIYSNVDGFVPKEWQPVGEPEEREGETLQKMQNIDTNEVQKWGELHYDLIFERHEITDLYRVHRVITPRNWKEFLKLLQVSRMMAEVREMMAGAV